MSVDNAKRKLRGRAAQLAALEGKATGKKLKGRALYDSEVARFKRDPEALKASLPKRRKMTEAYKTTGSSNGNFGDK